MVVVGFFENIRSIFFYTSDFCISGLTCNAPSRESVQYMKL